MKGKWIKAEVIKFNRDKSKILLKFESKEPEWYEITGPNTVKKALPDKMAVYIQLPSMSSRHFGMNHKGFCIER